MRMDLFLAWASYSGNVPKLSAREVRFMAPGRFLAVAAVFTLTAVSLAACGGGGDDKGSSGGNVTMQLWENATTGPGKAFWDKTAADFHTAHPNVTIKIQT